VALLGSAPPTWKFSFFFSPKFYYFLSVFPRNFTIFFPFFTEILLFSFRFYPNFIIFLSIPLFFFFDAQQKPANFLYDDTFRVVVADFGLSLGNTEAVCGLRSWMGGQEKGEEEERR
jgi:hypothetical protein